MSWRLSSGPFGGGAGLTVGEGGQGEGHKVKLISVTASLEWIYWTGFSQSQHVNRTAETPWSGRAPALGWLLKRQSDVEVPDDICMSPVKMLIALTPTSFSGDCSSDAMLLIPTCPIVCLVCAVHCYLYGNLSAKLQMAYCTIKTVWLEHWAIKNIWLEHWTITMYDNVFYYIILYWIALSSQILLLGLKPQANLPPI